MRELSRGIQIRIKVNGEAFSVPERVTVKEALEHVGYEISRFPGGGDLFVPCGVGGCWSCAVQIDGDVRPSCVSAVKYGMEIETELPRDYVPKRIVHGWMGHSVGGVGTPWQLKNHHGHIEAAVFACGCNLRCPQCQNWTTTYCGKGTAFTPEKAALLMTYTRRSYGVDRMAISGGECTLNRRWLVEYIRELKRLNPDEKARFHIDTNATILTDDYIDELVEAGVTDIGPDLKGLHLDTFMRITGLDDEELAKKYQRTSWNAAKYLIDNHRDEVFIGIGIPYNKDLISIEEVVQIGVKIAEQDLETQICVLDYKPEFRRRNISRPSFDEMKEIWKALNSIGLSTVVCQTERGHIGPTATSKIHP